jgi:hypothetical protein
MTLVHLLARRASLASAVGLLVFANGCSDPVDPAHQASFEATFSGTACPATVDPGPTIKIGSANPIETTTLPHGSQGVRASCKVVPQNDGFYVYINVATDSTSMQFEATMPADVNKTVDAKKVAIAGPNTIGGPYTQQTFPCKVKYIDGAAGRIKASYSCQGMWNGMGSSSSTCDISGMVAAENCAQQ